MKSKQAQLSVNLRITTLFVKLPRNDLTSPVPKPVTKKKYHLKKTNYYDQLRVNGLLGHHHRFHL